MLTIHAAEKTLGEAVAGIRYTSNGQTIAISAHVNAAHAYETTVSSRVSNTSTAALRNARNTPFAAGDRNCVCRLMTPTRPFTST
jgi:hypothetical protein